MKPSPKTGDRITDPSAAPDERTVRDWIGPQAFDHWAMLRSWIDAERIDDCRADSLRRAGDHDDLL